MYNDSESKTSSASITIASTDGVNFTETDNETDPYIFTHQQNPGGPSPADQQTGYVSVDMSRVLRWGASGTVTLVSSTVGADGSYQDAVKGNGTFSITGAGKPANFTSHVNQGGSSAGEPGRERRCVGGWLGTCFNQISTGIETGTQNATATGGAATVTNAVTATAAGGVRLVQTTPTTTETIIYSQAGLVLSDVFVKTATGQTLESRAYTYDNNGNKLTETDGSNTTAWTYDANGHKLTETNAYRTTGAATTHYTYDLAGNLISVTEPDSNPTTFAYNSLGEVTSMTDPLGHPTYETYNDQGETRRSPTATV